MAIFYFKGVGYVMTAFIGLQRLVKTRLYIVCFVCSVFWVHRR